MKNGMKRLFPILVLALLLLYIPPAFAQSSLDVLVQDSQNTLGGVTVATLVNGVTYSSQTGPDGKASFNLQPGKYTFTAMKEGYRQASVTGEAGVDSLVTIRMDRLYSISGTVIDASTEKPQKDASVTITDKETQQYYTGTTDEYGVFSIKVPNGYYGITVRVPQYHPIFRDNNGAGYHIQDSALYVGYMPVASSGSTDLGNEGVKVTCDYPGKNVKVNESVSFDIKIGNNGAVDKTYQLVVKESPWNVKFYSGNDEINRVFVEKGNSKTLQVKTTPLEEGSFFITIMAAAASDNSSLQLFIDAARDKDCKIELYVPGNITLNSGTSQNVEAVVKNNGSTKLTNVRLDIGEDDIPQSLTATVNTRNLDELGPGETKRFVIQIYAKADASQGSDRLYMRAVSNEVKSSEEYVDVEVLKSSTWVGVGIGIAVVAILAFGLIVWKYGRR